MPNTRHGSVFHISLLYRQPKRCLCWQMLVDRALCQKACVVAWECPCTTHGTSLEARQRKCYFALLYGYFPVQVNKHFTLICITLVIQNICKSPPPPPEYWRIFNHGSGSHLQIWLTMSSQPQLWSTGMLSLNTQDMTVKKCYFIFF